MELAEIAGQQKRSNDMISWLEKARNTTPAEVQARIILTRYYLRNAHPDKAVKYVKEAIKQQPERADIIALYGKVLLAQKRYKEALPSLKKLAAISPGSAEAHRLLGAAYLHQSMLGEARKHLQKALLIQPDNFSAISLLAVTELNDNNPDKSIEHTIALQKLQPKNYIGHMLEGDAWMAKKNNNRARTAYNNAWQQEQTARLAKKLFLTSKDSVGFNNAATPLLTW